MRTRIVATAMGAVAALGLALAAARGQEPPAGDPADAPVAKRTLAQRQEIPGKLVCIGCWLEKRAGAESACTLHAKHAQGLLAPDGTLWTLVDNARGHGVITNAKIRDKELEIRGWRYPKGQYIEVWSYQVRAGGGWTGYDWCKVCGWEVGDNKDTDLCDGCRGE